MSAIRPATPITETGARIEVDYKVLDDVVRQFADDSAGADGGYILPTSASVRINTWDGSTLVELNGPRWTRRKRAGNDGYSYGMPPRNSPDTGHCLVRFEHYDDAELDMSLPALMVRRAVADKVR